VALSRLFSIDSDLHFDIFKVAIFFLQILSILPFGHFYTPLRGPRFDFLCIPGSSHFNGFLELAGRILPYSALFLRHSLITVFSSLLCFLSYSLLVFPRDPSSLQGFSLHPSQAFPRPFFHSSFRVNPLSVRLPFPLSQTLSPPLSFATRFSSSFRPPPRFCFL